MISKKEAFKIAKEYVISRNRDYLSFYEDKVVKKVQTVFYGDLDLDEEHEMWIVPYDVEGRDYPEVCFVLIKASTGEVYYTMSELSYVERYEDL